MSYFLCNTIALQADLTKSTFTVYQYLAKSADNKTRSCYKKGKTIAEKCGLSYRTVQRATKELAEKGLLEIRKQFVEKGIINTTKGKQINNLFILKDISSKPNGNCRTYTCKSELSSKTLTGTELKVYHSLSARANQNDECFPSSTQIAKDCGISVSTVFRCLKVLISKTIIKMKHQYRNITGKKAKSNNRYNLNCKITQAATAYLEKTDIHNAQENFMANCTENTNTNTYKRFIRITLYLKYMLSFILSVLSPTHISTLSPLKTIVKNKANLKEEKYIYSKLTKRYIPRE